LITQIKPGEAYAEITLQSEEKALLRGPTWNDLDDLTDYINALVHERAEITKAEPVKREEEAEWLGQRLSDIENGSVIMLVAEVNQKVVGVGEVSILEGERSHTGYLGISVAKK